MSTLKEPKTKTAKRFRVKIGDSYAALSTDFHEKGVFVKCHGVQYATEFKRNVDAGNAIHRTLERKKEIEESMHVGWAKFDPLRYEETPTVEEYEITVEVK